MVRPLLPAPCPRCSVARDLALIYLALTQHDSDRRAKFSFADFNWSIYDYHPQDDGGFWQLQPGFSPSDQLPLVIPLSVTKRFPFQQPKDAEWTCLGPACPSKPFKHKGDLERHYKQAHPNGVPSSISGLVTTPTFESMPQMPAMPPNVAVLAPAGGVSPVAQQQDSNSGTKDTKEKEAMFYCDYAPCPRKMDGFNRKDRFRQHLQDNHKEDVVKKGGKLDDQWLDGRKMSDKWWRCSKCLERVKVEEHGWECPRDQVKCETRRREYREKLSLSG